MKTTPPIGLTAAMALLCGLSASCVSYTTVKDEPRREVHFASARTAQVFYDAYAGIGAPKVKDGRSHSITVGVELKPPYWQSTKQSENVKFNAAVQTADTNGDGVISAKEARVYAAKTQEEEDAKVGNYP